MGFGALNRVVLVGGGLWALGVFAAGCSSDSDERSSLSREDFISSVCEEYAPCCAAAEVPTDGAPCREFYESSLPQAGFDGAAASACLDAYRTFSDKCSGFLPPTACDAVFASAGGTKQPGEDCESASDCALPKEGHASCVNDYGVDGSAVQKCQVRRAGVAGSSPCLATSYDRLWILEGDYVATGYFCDAASGIFCDGGSLACRPFFKEGEGCSPNAIGCDSSTYCDIADSKCHPRNATGEACDDRSCVAGNFCNDSRKCAPALAAGARCTTGIECLSGLCLNGECDVDPFADANRDLLCGSR
jgi:Dickkopf N-terminal cysteine-rich region